jgi:hypothetical protein
MTSVHGITVFGGTFPAQIWNSYIANSGIPCEEFSPPEQPIEWSPFFGKYSSSSSTSGTSTYENTDTSPGENKYDPSLYAPGAGQKPAPQPKPQPKPEPKPPKPAPPPTPTPPVPAPPPAEPPPPTGGVGGG